MDRILQGTSSTIMVTFSVDGEPADPSPDSATVVVKDSAGVEVYNGAAANEGTGEFSLVLTPAQTATLDTLTATWSMTYAGDVQVVTTVVEVVGGYLFNVSDLRALLPTTKASAAIPTAQIIAVRTLAEQALEDACGVAFVPRYARETVNGTGSTTMFLRWPYIRQIRSLTVNDVAGTTSDVAFQPTGVLYYPAGWTCGHSNIVVGYEHGHDYPPLRVSQACLLLAKQWILSSPIDDRATSISNDDGTFALMTPGLRGAIFGLPEVEATINQYNMNVGIA